MIDFFKCPQDWLDFFYRDDVKSILDEQEEKGIAIEFEPFYKIPYHRVNVVILSVKNKKYEYQYSIRHISKSFQEIYKELENEGYYPTKDGNIDHWYKNGILFFDASSLPLSLTEKIIDFLNEKKDIIWLFLNEEKEIREVLSNISNTPSSTSVFFNDPLSKSFSGCNVFKKIDKILKSQGEDTISW